MRLLKKTFIILFLFFTIFLVNSTLHAHITKITEIRSWDSGEYTRIVFDLNSSVKFQAKKNYNKPISINITLSQCINATGKNSFKIVGELAERITVKRLKNSQVKVYVILNQDTEYKIFSLSKFRNKPDRLVIDIANPDYHNNEQRIINTINTQKEQNWIIVIDPGHGGEDPGAIGKGKCMEKDIVLAVGKKLKTCFDSEPNIKAYLTRTGDYFIPLRKRVEIAHKYHADIFISLHANACKKPQKSGASVYYLSKKGASDKASQLLAKLENASDLIGGVNLELENDDYLGSILIDLAQTHTLNRSISAGEVILENISSIKGIRKDGKSALKCANFAVLKSPKIPSVLVELSYITNSHDLKLLTNKENQKVISQKIASGVQQLLKGWVKDTPNYAKTAQKIDNTQYKIHTVKKGETLWRIAHNYGLKLSYLKTINGIKDGSHISAGQRLKIPSM